MSLRDLLNRPAIVPDDNGIEENEENGKSELAPNSKKIQKIKKPAKKLKSIEDLTLTGIGIPQVVEQTPSCQKRYSVDVLYKDQKGIRRKKLIRFGSAVRKNDYIDHKNEKKRNLTLSKMKNQENWLHPNFYKAYLLNSNCDDVFTSYQNLLNALNMNHL